MTETDVSRYTRQVITPEVGADEHKRDRAGRYCREFFKPALEIQNPFFFHVRMTNHMKAESFP